MLGIILFATVVLIIINIFYRVLIDQDKVVKLKARMKELQDEANKYKDDPTKQKEYFSKMMEENREMTKMSFKPMIVSFVIIMVMLPVVSIFYTDFSLTPIDTGSVTIDDVVYHYDLQDNTSFTLSSDSQTISCELSCFQEVDGKYFRISKVMQDGTEQIRMARIVAVSPVEIPFIGHELAWIWLYVIISIPLSLLIKKLLGVKI